MKNSEEEFWALFNLIPDFAVIVDGEGKVLAVNDAVEKTGGFRREELVGKSFLKTSALTAESGAVVKGGSAKGTTGVQMARREVDLVTKGGEIRWAESLMTKIEWAGKPANLVVFRDTTERRRVEEALRESEEKYRVFMEEAPIGLCNVDFKGVITFVNRRFEKVTGYSREEVVGKNGSELGLFDNEILGVIRQRMTTQLEGKSLTPLDVQFKCKDGKWIWIEVEGRLIRKWGIPVGFQLISEDITERKHMEQELRKHTEHLEKLVEERTKKLLETERLAAIGQTTAMVGHDLRNPLQAIASATYLAKTKYENLVLENKELAEKGRMAQLLIKIDDQVKYMNKIVSDLQDYSRHVQPQLAETSLPRLIDDAISTIAVPDTVKVSVVIEKDFPKLMIDPALMRRVFTNFVTNALQAMPNGGQLTIKPSRTYETAAISFVDTGVGIPEEALHKLFTPLFTTKAKGQGLGLAVCKRFVEAHGGTISVESKVGEGSTFTVRLPLKRDWRKEEVS